MIILEATASFVSVKDGAFHTSYRYLRERSVAGAFAMVSGPTCGMVVSTVPGTSELWICWKCKIGSYSVEETLISGTTAATVTQSVNTVDG